MGVKQSFLEGRGEWTLAAYHIVKDKLLTTDPNRPGITVQVGQQSSRGLEASLSLGLWEGVRGDVNGALLRTKYDDFIQTVVSVVWRLRRDWVSVAVHPWSGIVMFQGRRSAMRLIG